MALAIMIRSALFSMECAEPQVNLLLRFFGHHALRYIPEIAYDALDLRLGQHIGDYAFHISDHTIASQSAGLNKERFIGLLQSFLEFLQSIGPVFFCNEIENI